MIKQLKSIALMPNVIQVVKVHNLLASFCNKFNLNFYLFPNNFNHAALVHL